MAEDRSQKVLIFPAQPTGGIGGGGLLFLFSMGQVEDILKSAPVHPVPFAPPHIQGMARWRERVLPVIWPEGCLGVGGEGQRGGGTEGQRGGGTEGQRDGGTEGQRGGGTEGQRDRGTEGQSEGGDRFIVVRTVVGEGADRRSERAMFRAGGPVELLPVPGGAAPAAVPGAIRRADRVRAAYAWENRTIIVLDTGRILMEKG